MKDIAKLEPVILQRNSAEIDRKIENNEKFAENLNAILDLFKTEYEKIKYRLTAKELLKSLSGQLYLEGTTNGVTNPTTFFNYITEQEIKLKLEQVGLNIQFAKARELFKINDPSKELVTLLSRAFQILGGGFQYNGVGVDNFEVDEEQKIIFKESEQKRIIGNHSTILSNPKEIKAYHKISALLVELSKEVRELNGNNGTVDISLLFKTVINDDDDGKLNIELLHTCFPSFRKEYLSAMHGLHSSQPAPAKGLSEAQKQVLFSPPGTYPGVFI